MELVSLLLCLHLSSLTVYPGKSTLLQIFAGKRLIKGSTAKVMDQEVFFNTPGGVTYLGTEWANNPVVRSDLIVSHFM